MTDIPAPAVHAGREEEVRLLRDALGDVSDGRAACVLIEGDPGIGKTRVAEQAVRMARELRFDVLIGSAYEVESTRPFGALAEALSISSASPDPARAEVAGLLSAGAGIDTPQHGYLIVEALLALLEATATSGPVLLLVEDVHWADPSSLDTLAAVRRRLTHLPLMLIATLRPAPRSAALTRTMEGLLRRGAAHIVLRPLDDSSVLSIAGQLLDAPPGPLLQERLRATGGNPLFVRELIGALQGEGQIRMSAGYAEVERTGMPARLRMTIVRRLGLLPQRTIELLRTASILGPAFAPDHVRRMTGRTGGEVALDLQAAVDAGVVHESGTRLAFNHELISQALYEEMAFALRKQLHKEAARTLIDAGGESTEIAWHMRHAAEQGDDEAVRWLWSAGREVASAAPAVAAGLFEDALGLLRTGDPIRTDILTDLLGVLTWSGRAGETEEVVRRELDEGADPRMESQLRHWRARALFLHGRVYDAVAELERAAACAGDRERLRIDAERSMYSVYAGDVDAAAAFARAVQEAAAQSEDPLAESIAWSGLSMADWYRGYVGRAVDAGRSAVANADRAGAVLAHRYHPNYLLASALFATDRHDEALEALAEGRRWGERLGTTWQLPHYHWLTASIAFHSGRWDDAIAEVEAGFEVAEDVGMQLGAILAYTDLAAIAFHRGRLDEAGTHLAAAERAFAESPTQLGVWKIMLVRGLLVEAAAGPAGALSLVGSACDLLLSLGAMRELMEIGPDLVRLAHDADPQLAASVTAAVLDAAERNPVASWRGRALRCRGMRDGDPDVLLEAVAAYAASPDRAGLAFAREDAAGVLARHGRQAEAVVLLRETLDDYDSFGAAHDAGRVTAMLRSLGVRIARSAAPSRPITGWDSLTATENRVVGLLAEGLTNPQIGQRLFISRRTVETHLKHVFQKLGMSSRVEVAADAARRASAGS